MTLASHIHSIETSSVRVYATLASHIHLLIDDASVAFLWFFFSETAVAYLGGPDM